MFRTLMAALAVGALGWMAVASAQEKGDVDKELKRLEGTWTIVAAEIKGQKAPEDDLKGQQVQMVFKGNKYAQPIMGEIVEEGTFQIDPSKKPATMDMTIQSGKDKGKTQLCIYEIKGDTLKVSMADPGSKERPTSFTTTEKDAFQSAILKREKK
jgi:uncharacterized protein (TIGR03067 family)